MYRLPTFHNLSFIMLHKVLTVLLSTVTSQQTEQDQSFHAWCDHVGIQTPCVRLETTPKSVAGRGVFASEDIPKGATTIQIPDHVVFHSENARMFFPDVAADLDRSKKLFFDPSQQRSSSNRKTGGWKKFFRKSTRVQVDYNFLGEDNLWQAELTAYALACIEGDHPWGLWISQWMRDDPVQELLASGANFSDEEKIMECVEKLHESSPDLPRNKLWAAVDLRLRRIEEMKKLYELDDKRAIEMLGILTSRAMALGGDITGVLPMFDMINHSTDPNLGLSFCDGNFELIALRDLREDEELFVNYQHDESKATEDWDEDNAVWNLIQWGIPQTKSKTSSARDDLQVHEPELQVYS